MRKASGKIISVVVALTLAGTLFATAQSRSSAHPSFASLPTLRLNYYGANKGRLARTLDPSLVSLSSDADTIALTNANLVYIGTDDKVHLGLAKSFKVSKNRKVYTFTLRNAKYSNGDKVVAGDIAYTITRSLLASTASPVATTYLFPIKGALDFNAGKASKVAGLKVINSKTLQITLDKPYAFFLLALTYPTADALDQKVLKGKTAAQTGNFLTSNCPGNVGAGPFKFQCNGSDFFPSGQTRSYTLVPNRFYYGKKARVKLVLPATDTLDTDYKLYQSGGLDVTGIPTPFISQWKGKSKQYQEAPTSIVTYITPNLHMAPMNDVHCRLAVSYGIDRNTIINKILRGNTHSVYSVVPPGFLGYYSGKDSPHFNLKRAKAEFNKCSSASRKTPLKITYVTGSSDADNTWGEINNEMKKVGFNSSLNALSGNDWGNVVSQGLDKTQTQLVRNGWQQDYPDPQDYVTTLLKCGNDYDIGYFCNKKFDSLVNKADLEGNSKKRAALYIQAQKIAIHAGAWIPLTNALFHVLIKPNVHGLVASVAYGDVVPKNLDWSNVTKK